MIFETVMRCKLVKETLHFGSWSSMGAKSGCSVKTDQL